VDGREVIDAVLPLWPHMLSRRGVGYLVLVAENKPQQVARWFAAHGMVGVVVATVKAKNEQLMVMRVRWAGDSVATSAPPVAEGGGSGT